MVALPFWTAPSLHPQVKALTSTMLPEGLCGGGISPPGAQPLPAFWPRMQPWHSRQPHGSWSTDSKGKGRADADFDVGMVKRGSGRADATAASSSASEQVDAAARSVAAASASAPGSTSVPVPLSASASAQAPAPAPATAASSSTPSRPKGWVHFAAGGVGGMCGAIITSPLDVVKTRLQSDMYRAKAQTATAASAPAPAGALARVRSLAWHFVETGQLLR